MIFHIQHRTGKQVEDRGRKIVQAGKLHPSAAVHLFQAYSGGESYKVKHINVRAVVERNG